MVSNGGGLLPDDADNEEDGDEHHEGDPRPLPYAFEKELIQKSNRHIRLTESFVPVTKVSPLTSKFYAHHEQRKPRQPERFLRYTEVAQLERRTPLGVPLLESQVYGWLPLKTDCTPTIHLNVAHAPKLRCGMTIHGEHLLAERVTERPPFNGLRFLLH
ncbi:uncharacterized protein LOC115628769 [Scaptodrosophila lebanonensis]|uniref:Uncharacterized protein LOC115628769 n=1 Tax=Drosophila lebanonensis TaxID=7225 RepID=A0A6J2TXK2_DROLE|nr:uncharacterized protein LOC115628769 [Scaptodrosophila lebanonensis]